MKYRRAVLKISGEAMGRPGEGGLDPDRIDFAARQIVAAAEAGAELGVVVGGGNFLRGGRTGAAFGRVAADQMGMLATVINGMALKAMIEERGGAAAVRSAVAMPGLVDPIRAAECREVMGRGVIVILAGGTGNPFFTTDSACALRCLETGADLMMKATKVDGVYAEDPVTHPGATRFDALTYAEVLDRRLGVMDLTAVELCRSGGVPILVFDFQKDGNIIKAIRGEAVGTLIS